MAPMVLRAAGEPPKTIAEFVGRLATGTDAVSIAVMQSPSGWSEPGQRPEFDEYSIVLAGQLKTHNDHSRSDGLAPAIAQLAALLVSIATINGWNRLNAATRQVGGDWVEQLATPPALQPA
jgi:hypothetical protein